MWKNTTRTWWNIWLLYVSPLVALSRALKSLYGNDLKVVFIGPCIAKKAEIKIGELEGEIDAAITFIELRQMFSDVGITQSNVGSFDFDPPHAGPGALFPLSHGLLQAADIPEDLINNKVVTADGKTEFVEAIKEFEAGDLDICLLDVLCCNGCIMGPGMSSKAPLFNRRARVSSYVRNHIAKRERQNLLAEIANFLRP